MACTAIVLGMLHMVKIVWWSFPNVEANVEIQGRSINGLGKVVCKSEIRELKSKGSEFEKDLNEVIAICRDDIK